MVRNYTSSPSLADITNRLLERAVSRLDDLNEEIDTPSCTPAEYQGWRDTGVAIYKHGMNALRLVAPKVMGKAGQTTRTMALYDETQSAIGHAEKQWYATLESSTTVTSGAQGLVKELTQGLKTIYESTSQAIPRLNVLSLYLEKQQRDVATSYVQICDNAQDGDTRAYRHAFNEDMDVLDSARRMVETIRDNCALAGKIQDAYDHVSTQLDATTPLEAKRHELNSGRPLDLTINMPALDLSAYAV